MNATRMGLFFRLPSLLLAVASLLLLPGCWDKRELNDIAIIRALGVDLTEDGQIEVSGQQIVPTPTGQNGGQKGQSGKQTVVASGTGVTIADALSRMQGQVGRTIFLGHTEVVVFGERLARKGLQPTVDYLIRYPELRTRVQAFVTEGSPLEILNVQPVIQDSSAELLMAYVQNGRDLNVDMNHLSQMLSGDAQAAILPMLKSVDPTRAVIVGVAVFRKDKMVSKIDLQTTRGIMWLRDEMHSATVSVPLPKTTGQVSLEVIESKTDLLPRIEGNRWTMTVRVRAEDDLIQNGTPLQMGVPFTQIVQKQAELDLRRRIRQALRKVQQEAGTDVIGFAEAFHRKYPEEWRKVKNRWPEQFRKIPVNLDVKIYVRRTGMTKQPAGLPTERMQRR